MCTTFRRTATVIALALAALPAAASAIPNGGGLGDPPDAPPAARFTIAPNPALAGRELVIAREAFVDAGRVFGGDLVKFNASASTDDSGIAKYEWDLDANGTYEVSGADKATTSRRYTAVGTYAVKLRVTDDAGQKRIVSHNLIVHRAPVARLTATPTVALVGQQIDVSGATSTDDGGIVKYELDLDGDGTYEKVGPASASTAFTTLGERTLHLRVTDNYGATATDAVKVTVHRAPTAAFSATPNPAFTDQLVTFDASAATDDEPIARYEWDLDGDGTYETDTAGEPKATKSYPAPGTVTTRLRVTDSHGVQDVVTQSLTVNPKPVDAMAPVVTITPGKAKLRKGGRVLLTIACPATEIQCTGRVDLRSLRGARSAKLGGRTFSMPGGEKVRVAIKLSKANRKLVRKLRRLRTQATATATDAANNTGTAQRIVTIRR